MDAYGAHGKAADKTQKRQLKDDTNDFTFLAH